MRQGMRTAPAEVVGYPSGVARASGVGQARPVSGTLAALLAQDVE